MASPTLQFVRSWFVELKIGALVESFKCSVYLQKSVDPMSGMTVNLMAVDQAWQEARDLLEKSWTTPADFLQALSHRWQTWLLQEKAHLRCLKIENLEGRAWELTPAGLAYKTTVRLPLLGGVNKTSRKIRLTSEKPLTESELQAFLDQNSHLGVENISELRHSYPRIQRIEVLDPFEQFVEFDRNCVS